MQVIGLNIPSMDGGVAQGDEGPFHLWHWDHKPSQELNPGEQLSFFQWLQATLVGG